MRTAGYHVALLLAAVLASGSALLTAGAASAQQQAITATVTGAKIQKVGFRAMIQKEAIMYDLAGFARNKPDGTVEVRLQGDKDRIDQTLAAIRAGSKKSSQNNTISQVSLFCRRSSPHEAAAAVCPAASYGQTQNAPNAWLAEAAITRASSSHASRLSTSVFQYHGDCAYS